MKEFADDIKSGDTVLGDTLETALELGEKHEAFVTNCKTVGVKLFAHLSCVLCLILISLSLSLSPDNR